MVRFLVDEPMPGLAPGDRSWSTIEEVARLRAEHSRFKRTLETIRDTKQTAGGARLLATHALQDGHTEMAAPCMPAAKETDRG